MQVEQTTFVVNVMWGSVSMDGEWKANPHLMMTEGQQLKANLLAGTLPQNVRLTAEQAKALIDG